MNNIKMIYVVLVQKIHFYGIIVWGSTNKNTSESLNVAHRTPLWIMWKHLYNENNCTDDRFKIFKTINIGQSYNNLAIIKMYKPNINLNQRIHYIKKYHLIISNQLIIF